MSDQQQPPAAPPTVALFYAPEFTHLRQELARARAEALSFNWGAEKVVTPCEDALEGLLALLVSEVAHLRDLMVHECEYDEQSYCVHCGRDRRV